MVAGALLAFALSFDEVIVTTFTAGQQQTLPIWILANLSRPNQLPIVNVVGVLVILLSAIPVYFAHRLTVDQRGRLGGRRPGRRGRGGALELDRGRLVEIAQSPGAWPRPIAGRSRAVPRRPGASPWRCSAATRRQRRRGGRRRAAEAWRAGSCGTTAGRRGGVVLSSATALGVGISDVRRPRLRACGARGASRAWPVSTAWTASAAWAASVLRGARRRVGARAEAAEPQT